jgi:MoaA/NifB/PqqE/SkfB family radical SAM enzyme
MDLVRVEHSDKRFKEWVRVEWNLGLRCNFDCSYCPKNIHDNTSPHAPFEDFLNTTRTIRSAYEGKQIRLSITGGEPFVHPRILDILKMFREEGMDEISTISNGSLPVEKYLKALETIDHLIFSWHFEHLREDHMREVLLATKGQNVHLHLMLLPGRLEEIKSLISWLEENGINYDLRRIRPLFRPGGGFNPPGASGMVGVHSLADPTDYYSKEEHEFLESIVKAGKRNNVELFTRQERWLDNVNTLLKNRWNDFRGWQCMAGIETLMIDNDGKVYRATCKQGGPIGTISEGFEIPKDPITCAKRWCNCAADLNTTKWRDDG